MQLQVTVNSLAVNTYQSLSTASVNQPAVLGTVAPASPVSEHFESSVPPRIVTASGAGAQSEKFSEQRQHLTKESTSSPKKELSPTELVQREDERRLLQELAARDREVRQHELSHAAAGGSYAGAPTYEFERGPDGQLYAVAGEVKIDTSAVPDDPEATLEKAEVILRAALAVAEPSAQDRAVAARAAVMAAEARAEIAQQERQLAQAEGDNKDSDEVRDSERAAAEVERNKERAERKAGQAELIQDFNQRQNDINFQLAEINQRLLEAGVFQKYFPEGSLLDQLI